MNNDFTPWLDALGTREKRRREFFTKVFAVISSHGFTLENPNAIDGGYRLSFKRGDCWVVADRYSSFPVAGETPGIHLYDETNSWEASFTAYTPMHIVIEAINALAADE